MRLSSRVLLGLLSLALVAFAPRAAADDLPEYRLKAAFLYNFALFTEWPAEVGPTLKLCIHGKDPFGEDGDALQGKKSGARTIAVHRESNVERLKSCQIVFIAGSAAGSLPRLLETLHGAPVLTVADTPGAAAEGVVLNMNVVQNRITFEANLDAARRARLNLSSKLLRLATEVRQ